jgi:hypothetical protein
MVFQSRKKKRQKVEGRRRSSIAGIEPASHEHDCHPDEDKANIDVMQTCTEFHDRIRTCPAIKTATKEEGYKYANEVCATE